MTEQPSDMLFISRPTFHPPGEELPKIEIPPKPCLDELEPIRHFEFPIIHRFDPERAKEFGPEYFRVDYQFHSFMPVLLNVRLHAEGSETHLSHNTNDMYAFRHEVDLSNLRSQATNERVWEPTHTLAIRADWSLEWWNPPVYRVVSRMYPPPGPFLDLCMCVLRSAGFEFEATVSPRDGHSYHSCEDLMS